jgi:uracil-DNA glycosylase family 4
MDERLREEIAAWLEFYRDLGIESFYLQRSGAPETPAGPQEAALSSSAVSTESKAAPAELPIPVAGAAASSSSAYGFGRAAGGHGALAPPVQTLSLFESPPAARRERETLEQIREDLGDCRRCKLATGRRHIVFGQGNPRAEVVLVGEGPGADEDEQGLPFVGRAGQLLNKMLQLVGIEREEVYICNVVKCRPPGNRTPEPDEVETCSPFLFRQLEAIQPRLVCCLGAPAARTVLGLKEGILKVRGRFYDLGQAKALATVHPAYVLRNPREEKILREDFEKIREFLGRRSQG